MRTHRWILVTLVTLVALVATACSNGSGETTTTVGDTVAAPTTSIAAPTGEPLRLGAIFPLSGPAARNGGFSLEGAQIALDMINDRGGVCDRPVEFVVEDAPAPAAATSAANRLVDAGDVSVIVTDTSALALAVAPVAERGQVVMWETEGIAGPITGQGYQYVFRPPFSAGQMVAELAKFVATEGAAVVGKDATDMTVVIINVDTGFGTSTAAGFEAAIEAQGLTVVLKEAYAPDVTDLSSLVLKVRDAAPDVLLAASFIGDAILWHEQSQQLKYTPPLQVGTTAAQGTFEYFDAVGDAAESFIIGGIPSKVAEDKVSPELKALFDDVVERAGGSPDVLVLNGFDNTWILVNDVLSQLCGTEITPDTVREAVLALDLPLGSTILGKGVQFAGPDDEQSGQNLRAIAPVMQWQDGVLEVVAPESVATSTFQVPLSPAG